MDSAPFKICIHGLSKYVAFMHMRAHHTMALFIYCCFAENNLSNLFRILLKHKLKLTTN